MSRRSFWLLGWMALCASASTAHASNSVAPRGVQVVEAPGDPSRMFLSGTFGLLTSADDGMTWDFICEEALTGLPVKHTEPLFAQFGDGTLLAGAVGSRIGRSSAEACNWTWVLPPSEQAGVVDVAVSLAQPSTALALVAQTTFTDGAYVTETRLHRSADAGETWTEIGVLDGLEVAYSIAVAPSDGDRVYVTGTNDANHGVLLVSDDGGNAWSSVDVPNASGTSPSRIALIDPTDADTLYVVVDNWLPNPNEQDYYVGHDVLLRSTDAGAALETWMEQDAKLFDATLSPDGETLLVAWGDPQRDFNYTVDGEQVGVYASAASEKAFTKVIDLSTSCVHWTEKGLYACTPNFGKNAVVFSETVNLDGMPQEELTPLVVRGEVRGPLACGCVEGTCELPWYPGTFPNPPSCQILGQCPETGPLGGENTCVDGTGSGMGGAAGSGSVEPPDGGIDAGGGSAGTSAGSDAGTDDGGTTSDPNDDDGGCACRSVGQPSTPRGLAAWLGAVSIGMAALVAFRRRRRHP